MKGAHPLRARSEKAAAGFSGIARVLKEFRAGCDSIETQRALDNGLKFAMSAL